MPLSAAALKVWLVYVTKLSVPSQTEPVVLLMVNVPSEALAVMVLLVAGVVSGLLMVILGAVLSMV